MGARQRNIIVIFLSFLIVISTATAAMKTFRVAETDFVKLMPTGMDPDQDRIQYNFSAPLDEEGEWQTDYGDMGEYIVDITASDSRGGVTVEKVKLIVEHRNKPPIAEKKIVRVKEGEKVELRNLIVDPEEDPLLFIFEKPFDAQGVWNTDYDDEGSYVTTIIAFDGEFNQKLRIQIEVEHANQPPEITSAFTERASVTVKEGEQLQFLVEAEDPEGGALQYAWKLDGKALSQKNSGVVSFEYDMAGEHQLEVTVSDQTDQVERIWIIKVTNTNRAPQLELLPITVYENEKVTLDLPEKDEDGDTLQYEFEEPLNEQGEWQTDFEDEGKYKLDVTVSDGEAEHKEMVEVTVIGVDRPPQLVLPSEIRVRENEELLLPLDTFDPDNESIELSIEDAPEGMKLDAKSRTISWKPEYGFIARKENTFSALLHLLSVERYFLAERVQPIIISSCGKELCSQAELKIVVENVNRAPQFKGGNITINETEELELQLAAEDPDGDRVRYRFSEPVNRNGRWKTGYDDAGEYTVTVTASDGQLENTQLVTVVVKEKNRLPTLKIKDDDIVVNEGQEFTIRMQAEDPDEEETILSLENAPPGASFQDGVFVWEPSYTTTIGSNSWWSNVIEQSRSLNKKLNREESVVWLNFRAEDETGATVSHPVKVKVKNVNLAPEIKDYLPVEEIAVLPGAPVLFHIAASDIDGNNLTYTWDFGWGEEQVTGTDTVERTFTSAGDKTVSVTVSDGAQRVRKDFQVQVREGESLPAAPLAYREVALEQPAYSLGVYVVRE